MTKKTQPVVWSRGLLTYLRPIEEGDLPTFNRWINDPDMEQFLLRVNPISMPGQRAWYEQVTSDDPNKHTVAICRNEDDALLGNMFLGIDREKRKGSTGTIIGEEKYRSKGYGTDAKMQMLRYAFLTRNLRKVQSDIFETNGRSQRYHKGHVRINGITDEDFTLLQFEQISRVMKYACPPSG